MKNTATVYYVDWHGGIREGTVGLGKKRGKCWSQVAAKWKECLVVYLIRLVGSAIFPTLIWQGWGWDGQGRQCLNNIGVTLVKLRIHTSLHSCAAVLISIDHLC